jgi:hypothetical protein
MADQNIGTITLEEALNLFQFLRESIKEKKFKSVMVVMDLTLSWSCFCFFEKPFRCDFEKSPGIN